MCLGTEYLIGLKAEHIRFVVRFAPQLRGGDLCLLAWRRDCPDLLHKVHLVEHFSPLGHFAVGDVEHAHPGDVDCCGDLGVMHIGRKS